MKRLSDQYVAGILDGEGCIGIKKTTYKTKSGRTAYTPYVKVVMCDYIIPELFLHSFGGNTWERKRTDGWRSSKEWTITGKPKVGWFLKRISKKLIVKRSQAKIVMDFCALANGDNRGTPKETSDESDRLYEEIRKLNSRVKTPAETK